MVFLLVYLALRVLFHLLQAHPNAHLVPQAHTLMKKVHYHVHLVPLVHPHHHKGPLHAINVQLARSALSLASFLHTLLNMHYPLSHYQPVPNAFKAPTHPSMVLLNVYLVKEGNMERFVAHLNVNRVNQGDIRPLKAIPHVIPVNQADTLHLKQVSQVVPPPVSLALQGLLLLD